MSSRSVCVKHSNCFGRQSDRPHHSMKVTCVYGTAALFRQKKTKAERKQRKICLQCKPSEWPRLRTNFWSYKAWNIEGRKSDVQSLSGLPDIFLSYARNKYETISFKMICFTVKSCLTVLKTIVQDRLNCQFPHIQSKLPEFFSVLIFNY